MNSIFKRPLFRAAGGPVEQETPDQFDVDPQIAAMGGMAEQGQIPSVDPQQAYMANYEEGMAMGEGEGLGVRYMQQMMQGLDDAGDAEQLINALRGTEMPLEARYAELAELVGEEDAKATPETVLALVQPAIMLTEEGATNTGIGQILQNLMGDTEMENEEGPTPMGQGVGALMMQGAGNTPPQNFNQGGPVVRRFQTGGEATQGDKLIGLASEYLPAYQQFMGGDDEASKAQAYFAIARAAANWASGMGPQGQDIRGLSPGAQFAANLGGLSGDLEKVAGSKAEQLARLKALALQAAQGKLDKTEEREYQMLMKDRELAAQLQRDEKQREFELLKLRTSGDIERENLRLKAEIDAAAAGTAFERQQKLEVLKGEIQKDNTLLQGGLNESLARVNSELRIGENALRFEDELKMQGIKTADQLRTMERGQQYNLALQKSQAGLDAISREDTQAHDLLKQEIQNVFAGNQQLSQQEFESELRTRLQEGAQAFSASEAEKARAYERAFKMIDIALRREGLTLEGERVRIADATLLADMAYKDAMVALEKEKNKLAGLGSTEGERNLNRLVNPETVDKLGSGTLGSAEEAKFFSILEDFTKPSVTAAGQVMEGQSIPENVQQALRKRAESGGTLPNWLTPSMYGVKPTAEEASAIGQNIINGDVDLKQATGYLSGLKSVLNYLSESTVGELGGISGTMFTDVKAAQGALDSLNAAHRRFLLEGRQLAQELNLTLGELPEASFIATDASTAKKIEAQRNLLVDFISRTQAGLEGKQYRLSPTAQSNARELLAYAQQLLAADNAALASYYGTARKAPADLSAMDSDIYNKN